MLTKNEKKWLRERDKWFSPWCRRCDGRFHCDEYKLDGVCSLIPDTDDAAEFSERVAAKLANIHFGTEDCPYCSNHINVNEYCGECTTASTDKRCLSCRIKYARMQVEEEMNG